MGYKILKLIGRGANGDVFLANNEEDHSTHVIKRLRMKDITERERITIETELKLLKQFKHVNIVPFRDSFIDGEGSLNIVMGYCEGGDMHNLIEEAEGKKFTEKQITDWLIQLALSIFYLHERRILHRDIKTQNIFLTNGCIMLGDFGVSKVLDQAADLARTNIGTPYYMSPEQYRQKPYSYKSDIWAFGCIIYEMCNHKHVFEAMNINALAVKVMKGSYAPVSECYSENLRNLVDQMLSQNSKKRPSIIQILKKPFLFKKVKQYMKEILKNRNNYEPAQIDSLRAQARSLGLDLEESPVKKPEQTPAKKGSKERAEQRLEMSKERMRIEREKKYQELSEKLKKQIEERNKVQEKLKEYNRGSISRRSSEKNLNSRKPTKRETKPISQTPTAEYLSGREYGSKSKPKLQEIDFIDKEKPAKKSQAKKKEVIGKNFKIEEDYDMDYEEYSDKEVELNQIGEEEDDEDEPIRMSAPEKQTHREKPADKKAQDQASSKVTEDDSESGRNKRENIEAVKGEKLEQEVKQKTMMIHNIRNEMSRLDFVLSSDSECSEKRERVYNPAYTRLSERINDLKQKIIAQLGRSGYSTFLEFMEAKKGRANREEVISIVGQENVGVEHFAKNIMNLDRILQKIPMYVD